MYATQDIRSAASAWEKLRAAAVLAHHLAAVPLRGLCVVHGCGLAAVVHCVECDMHGAASVGSGMFCAVHDMLEHLFELHTREMWVGNAPAVDCKRWRQQRHEHSCS